MAGFAQAFSRGILTAAGIAVGLLATLVVVVHGDAGTAIERGLSLSVLSIVFIGAALIGALIGLMAGKGAASPGSGFMGGLLAGLLGQFLVLAAAFLGFAATDIDLPEGQDPVITGDVLAWESFGRALVAVAPAGLAAAIVGMASSPWKDRTPVRTSARVVDQDTPRAPMVTSAVVQEPVPRASADEPAIVARRLQCPSCHQPFEGHPGESPVCPSCGYGAAG